MDNNENINDSNTMVSQTIDELCGLIAESGDKEFLAEFFKCLFTPPELKDIANRWLLVKEIDKGTTQRDIAKNFGMSLCKITRGSKELAKENSAFRKMLDISKKKNK